MDKLETLERLARAVAADRKRVQASPAAWANTDLVSQWSVACSPERILALTAVIRAADTLRESDHTRDRAWQAYDAARKALA